MAVKISTFILSKDEASTIERTLESAAKFSDEIVVSIDDTTTDNTYDVVGRFASKYPGKLIVYEYTWKDSFCQARNQAMDKCAGDWIMQLDAHEIVRPGDEAKIRNLAAQMPENLLQACFLMLDEWKFGQPMSRFRQSKFFRNDPKIRYTGDMHNRISKETVPPEQTLIVEDIEIYHLRTWENNKRRKVQRFKMAEKIFLKEMEEKPEDTRSAFYLAQTYLNSNKTEKALEHYKIYLDRDQAAGSPYPDERAWALFKIGAIYAEMKKDFEKALYYFEQSLRWRADSPWCFYKIGDVFFEQGKLNDAAVYYTIAGNTPSLGNQLFQFDIAETYGPWLGLAEVYMQQEQYLKAFKSAMKGLDYNHEVPRLRFIVSTSLEVAAKQIETEDEKKKNLYVIDSTGQFTPQLIDIWKEDFNVKVTEKPDMALCTWADVIFNEWANEEFTKLSYFKFRAPLITRVHRYEIFRDSFRHVNWRSVYMAIFVCHDKRLLAGGLPTRTRVVYNTSNPEKFPLIADHDPLSLCYVGFIHPRKNLAYIIQLLHEVDPRREFKLHIAGEIQDSEYRRNLANLLQKLNMEKNVIFHGWQKDINAWLESIRASAIISASSSEGGVPNAIKEAMLKGCQPIVFPYPGAEDLYIPEMLFRDRKEFAERLYDPPKYPPSFWRSWITQRFPYSDYEKFYRDLMQDILRCQTAKKESSPATPYQTRLDIIKRHGQGKDVAEIGVFRGDFSKEILAENPKTLYLVDPWEGSGHSGDKDGRNRISAPDLGVFHREVHEWAKGKPNVFVMRMKSEDYFGQLEDDSLDLAYIDGEHTFEAVMKDLELARLKVRPFGYIAGHDYGPIDKNAAVKEAVDEFSYKYKYPIEVTTGDGYPSFVMRNEK